MGDTERGVPGGTNGTARTELIVVGAGVIGLSCAWSAARHGVAVTVLDPAPASGASWVAGGMLAPVTEAWPGEESLLELGAESLRGWPSFAASLGSYAGTPAGLRTEGTLVVAAGSGDRAELDELAGYLSGLGRDVERVTARELRKLEPSIGPDVRGGLSVPGDLAIDNRTLLGALRAACDRAGVGFVMAAASGVSTRDGAAESSGSASAVPGSGPCGVVKLADGHELVADEVLVAAGAHSAALHPSLAGLVRPVKGEIIRLRHRRGAFPPPARTVRGVVDGRHVYLVPRDDGGLVLGATQYEVGFDTEPTVGGVRDLLRDAERMVPAVAEYALVESSAGLRPVSPDNLPLIGRLGPGVLVATGHGRNGILLAPITAETVLALLRGTSLPTAAKAADPGRLQEASCSST